MEPTSIMYFPTFSKNSGGEELLLAHGLPVSDWASTTMGTAIFKTIGVSNTGLCALAGNSMHASSVLCWQ